MNAVSQILRSYNLAKIFSKVGSQAKFDKGQKLLIFFFSYIFIAIAIIFFLGGGGGGCGGWGGGLVASLCPHPILGFGEYLLIF